MRTAALLIACSTLVLGSVAATSWAAEPALRFRGAGSTRSALDAMQLKPFDQALWGNLGNWQGTAPTAEDMNGKVVMVVTWASWYKQSHNALKMAQGLYERHKGDGLVVVAVHNPRGWEAATETAKALRVTFPHAEDKDGKFRAGLKADQDPNIYFIDRSGNLRYAQVEMASAAEAAAHLLAETADSAKDYPAKLAKEKAEAERNRWKTGDASAMDPDAQIEVEFEEPDEEAYKAVKWPYLYGKMEADRILETWTTTPPKMEMVEEGWMPAAPKNKGRLLLVYMFDPKEVDMLNVIPVMNRIQTRYGRDVAVAGLAIKLGENLNAQGVQGEEAEKLTRRNTDLLKSVIATRNPNHPLQPQPVKMEQFEFSTRSGEQFTGIPIWRSRREEAGTAILLSTDSKLRWIGSPWSTDLPVAIEKVGAVDPAVQARRRAEALARPVSGQK